MLAFHTQRTFPWRDKGHARTKRLSMERARGSESRERNVTPIIAVDAGHGQSWCRAIRTSGRGRSDHVGHAADRYDERGAKVRAKHAMLIMPNRASGISLPASRRERSMPGPCNREHTCVLASLYFPCSVLFALRNVCPCTRSTMWAARHLGRYAAPVSAVRLIPSACWRATRLRHGRFANQAVDVWLHGAEKRS